jgi:hypothetical protein
MTNNGFDKMPEVMSEEIEVQLTTQSMLRLVALKGRQEIAQSIMERLISLYKELGEQEQYALDTLLVNLCEASGRTLPRPYEFMLDVDAMRIMIRKKD